MRRANGTGSIVNLGPNRRNRYAVRVSYLERPGLWKQKYLSYHRTAKEAQEALDKYLASRQSHSPLPGETYTISGLPKSMQRQEQPLSPAIRLLGRASVC